MRKNGGAARGGCEQVEEVEGCREPLPFPPERPDRPRRHERDERDERDTESRGAFPRKAAPAWPETTSRRGVNAGFIMATSPLESQADRPAYASSQGVWENRAFLVCSGLPTSIMEAALEDFEHLLLPFSPHAVDQPVLPVDAPRPPASELVPQRFGLTSTGEGAAPRVLD